MCINHVSSVIQGKIMFAKPLLFTSLLVCSFSIFVSVKGSNSPDSDPLRLVGQQKKTISKSQRTQHPLVKDVYHPDPTIFSEIAKQLKAGKFYEDFLRGILLYGPPGVGKNEMIKAIVNESGCRIFIAKASSVVSGHQGSGAEAIESIFDQARAVERGKGVIVLVDELQSLTPVTSDKNVPPAYNNSGLDHANALTQLWLEYDEEHDNIMIIATCNQFDRIDERIRGRFNCIKFPYPDEPGTIEILKNKSKHYGIPLSKSELKEYVKRMKGLSGRDLTKFIREAKKYTGRGKKKKEA